MALDPYVVWVMLKDAPEDGSRGSISCSDHDCGGYWTWPAAGMPTEKAARAWAQLHRETGCRPKVEVRTPAAACSPKEGTQR